MIRLFRTRQSFALLIAPWLIAPADPALDALRKRVYVFAERGGAQPDTRNNVTTTPIPRGPAWADWPTDGERKRPPAAYGPGEGAGT